MSGGRNVVEGKVVLAVVQGISGDTLRERNLLKATETVFMSSCHV